MGILCGKVDASERKNDQLNSYRYSDSEEKTQCENRQKREGTVEKVRRAMSWRAILDA